MSLRQNWINFKRCQVITSSKFRNGDSQREACIVEAVIYTAICNCIVLDRNNTRIRFQKKKKRHKKSSASRVRCFKEINWRYFLPCSSLAHVFSPFSQRNSVKPKQSLLNSFRRASKSLLVDFGWYLYLGHTINTGNKFSSKLLAHRNILKQNLTKSTRWIWKDSKSVFDNRNN